MAIPFNAPKRPMRARLTVSEYYRMNDVGLLDRYPRTELIDGEIIVLNALYVGHSRTHKALFLALNDSINASGSTLEVLGETTTELGGHDAPLPDITIFDPAATPSLQRGIEHRAVKMIVEVANSSAARDLGVKRKLYAQRAVPEYWVAVLKTRKIERFADPIDGDYRKHDSFAFNEAVPSVTLPNVGIDAGTLPQ